MLTEYEAFIMTRARTADGKPRPDGPRPSLMLIGIAVLFIAVLWLATSERTDTVSPAHAGSVTANLP
jgi:hypothetical protein